MSDLDFDEELEACEAYIKRLKRSDWSISDALIVRLEALRRLARLREIVAENIVDVEGIASSAPDAMDGFVTRCKQRAKVVNELLNINGPTDITRKDS